MLKAKLSTDCRNALKSATETKGPDGVVLTFPHLTSPNVVRSLAVWMNQAARKDRDALRSNGKELEIVKFRDVHSRQLCIHMRITHPKRENPNKLIFESDYRGVPSLPAAVRAHELGLDTDPSKNKPTNMWLPG